MPLLVQCLRLRSAIIAPWEGKSNDPYVDMVGVTTVCYGETRVDMRRYSDRECTAMLSDAVGEFGAQVLARNPGARNASKYVGSRNVAGI